MVIQLPTSSNCAGLPESVDARLAYLIRRTDDYRLCSGDCLGSVMPIKSASDCCCFRAARSHNAQQSAHYALRRQGEFFATPPVSPFSNCGTTLTNSRHYRGITFSITRLHTACIRRCSLIPSSSSSTTTTRASLRLPRAITNWGDAGQASSIP